MNYTIKTAAGHEDQKNSESAAIKVAKKWVEEGKTGVYISFYRSSDGQTGYINPDGAGVSGKPWDQ